MARLTQIQLAERAGISANYISALERDEPNARDGSPRRPRIDKVDTLARILKVPEDAMRINFGYAPATATRKPSTIPELVAALESLGIETPLLHGGFPKDEDGEGFREIVERIWLDIQLVTSRMHKGRTARMIPQRLDLYEDDDMQSEPRVNIK